MHGMIQILFTTLLFHLANANTACKTEEAPRPKYHLIEKCHRSTIGIIAKVNASLERCKTLAFESKGLAFNYSPAEVAKYMEDGDEPVSYNCEVLKCAECEGGATLKNDTRYDYYSIYAKNLPNINSSCVPGIGMFTIIPKSNYSSALKECTNRSGVLADVMTEQRTDALAQVLPEGVKEIYVGMKRVNGSGFLNINGYSLDCTTYRAWEPGHPRKKKFTHECTGLSRSKTWLTVKCSSPIQALCELLPSGPYKIGSIFASKDMGNETLES